MALTFLDLSRRGDLGDPFLPLFLEVQGHLATWMAAANTQNPDQLLEVVVPPDGQEGVVGWTIRATLDVEYEGAPLQFMLQWLTSPSLGTIRQAVGLASTWDPEGGYGAPHGLVDGPLNQSRTASFYTSLSVIAYAAWSLDPDQEFFCFCFNRSTDSRGRGMVLYIAKDPGTGQWTLCSDLFAGSANSAYLREICLFIGWAASVQQWRTAMQLYRYSGGTLQALLPRPHWVLNAVHSADPAELTPRMIEPLTVPARLASYTRTYNVGLVLRTADGAEWVLMSNTGLALRYKDGTPELA
ncbi:MAG: hypothetical protein EA413_00365 [Cyanobium sp. PLM2.Bin73]|nr:MAG: hypothetical protein EA413_00365 [Cyanobium sp. PLM2.Bin73]